jgi:hypothetical protein
MEGIALGKLQRPIGLWAFAAAFVFLLVAVETLAIVVFVIAGSDVWSIGMDYRFYRDVGTRWLEDGSFYTPEQLTGPYVGRLMVDVFYPPTALWLFVPFAVLPAVLWWAVPILVVLFALLRMRPRPWAWLIIAILLAWPRAIGAYLFGNTDIWIVAALASGFVWGWPAAFVIVKPALLPLVLPIVRRQRFWAGLAAVAALTIPTLPLWPAYVQAMRDLTIDLGHSIGSVPLMAIPLVAWLGSRQDLTKRRAGGRDLAGIPAKSAT